MVKAYLDASVLVPYFIREATTEIVTEWALAQTAPFVVSTFASAEFASVVSRYLRTGAMDRTIAEDRMAAHDRWVAEHADVATTDAIHVRGAARLVRRFDLGLRMPDAIHLATCESSGFALVTFDKALARAALTVGIAVVVPA